MESGRKKPSLETIIKIANALNISIEALLSDNLNNTCHNSAIIDVAKGCNKKQTKVIIEAASALKDILIENDY